jgi:hypothetical protein
MSAATPSWFVNSWSVLGRVDGSHPIDTFPELRDPITPPTFGLVVAEAAIDGDPATGYLEAGVEAFLVLAALQAQPAHAHEMPASPSGADRRASEYLTRKQEAEVRRIVREELLAGR